jgi:hypothetical protein
LTMSGTCGPRSACPQIVINRAVGGVVCSVIESIALNGHWTGLGDIEAGDRHGGDARSLLAGVAGTKSAPARRLGPSHGIQV